MCRWKAHDLGKYVRGARLTQWTSNRNPAKSFGIFWCQGAALEREADLSSLVWVWLPMFGRPMRETATPGLLFKTLESVSTQTPRLTIRHEPKKKSPSDWTCRQRTCINIALGNRTWMIFVSILGKEFHPVLMPTTVLPTFYKRCCCAGSPDPVTPLRD